jgi:hypothetical protein
MSLFMGSSSEKNVLVSIRITVRGSQVEAKQLAAAQLSNSVPV